VTGTPREHESHFHDLDDRDPLARFGRALEESAIEELAVDQHPLPSGPRHDARPEIERPSMTADERLHRRLLEHKQRAQTKTCGVAERKLELAEKNLASCGRLRRGARAELRAEVELQRRALATIREQLGETAAEIEHAKLRNRSVERTRVRELGGVAERRERARDRGLVLQR